MVNEFNHYIQDILSPFGTVKIKSMFGGYGVYINGLITALIIDNELYLKADKQKSDLFIEYNLEPFTYQRKDKIITMSYYKMSDEILEDELLLAKFIQLSYEASINK